MLALGLTGGMGMGKSTAATLLAATGVPVVDSDDLARNIVEPGQPALDEIRHAFGPEYLKPDSTLDRARLAALIFGDPNARARLEAITHPRIRALWEARFEAWRASGLPVAVAVIPLLFEVGLATAFDRVVCVACSEPTQRTRLACRGWSEAECRSRIGAQWPIERKMEAAQHVVWTEGNLGVHRRQWERVLGSLHPLQASLPTRSVP